MIKDPQAGYATKRGFAWLKVKPFFTVDLEVQDILPGTPGTKFENTMGAILFHGWHEGREISVSVGSGYTDKQRDEIWLNKDILLGRVAEIETDVLTQSQNSEVWSLRFPRFVRWRGWEPGEKL
jgi:DNA ligase-1